MQGVRYTRSVVQLVAKLVETLASDAQRQMTALKAVIARMVLFWTMRITVLDLRSVLVIRTNSPLQLEQALMSSVKYGKLLHH